MFSNPLPALYHAHHNQHQEDLPFWLDLASQANGTILELGCGTGRILLPLALAGFTGYGLDIDRDMLRFCSARLSSDRQDSIRLIQADMCRFHFAAQFDLILLPCNTLSTLTDVELQEMLVCVFGHLRPGAVFAASLPNPQVLARLPKRSAAEIEDVFAHPIDQEPVQVSSAWERSAQAFSLSWYYDHLLPDGQVERLTTVVKHQLRPTDEYLEALTSAGLNTIQLYGDFKQTPYRINSPNLVIVARSTVR